jgi:very-short-patch-repair endonuclease
MAFRNRMKPEKFANAKRMRKHPTKAEAHIWKLIRRKAIGNRWLRQSPMLGYIADFWCPKLRIILEVDGLSHVNRKAHDKKRDAVFLRRKIRTIRFTNEQALRFDRTALRHAIETVIRRPLLHTSFHRLPEVIKRSSTNYSQIQIFRPQQDSQVSHRNTTRSSSSQGNSKLMRVLVVKDSIAGGKVEKSTKVIAFSKLSLRRCEEVVQNAVKDRQPCKVQTYASMEVAENAVRAFRGLGITATPYKCRLCKTIHLREGRLSLTVRR